MICTHCNKHIRDDDLIKRGLTLNIRNAEGVAVGTTACPHCNHSLWVKQVIMLVPYNPTRRKED